MRFVSISGTPFRTTPGRRGARIVSFLAAVALLAAVLPALSPPCASAAGPPSIPNDNTCVTDGPVNTVACTGAATYIGGSFSYVGPHTGCGVTIDAAAGTVKPGFPKVNRAVQAAVPDGSGGWYIGGQFTRVGGVAKELHRPHPGERDGRCGLEPERERDSERHRGERCHRVRRWFVRHHRGAEPGTR